MTWFRVDDRFHSHPKALAAGPAALGLWVIAGSWSAANLTDGFVPDHVLPRLADGAEELARTLVAAGLWRRCRGGYRFHDWSDYQETRDDRLRKRQRWRDKKARQRATGRAMGEGPQVRQQMSPGDTPEDSPRDSPGESHESPGYPNPNPYPNPDTSMSSSSLTVRNARTREDDEDIDQAITKLLAEHTGRTVTRDWAARVRHQLLDGRPVARPLPYIAEAIRRNPRAFLPPGTPPETCPTHLLPAPCRGCAADRKAGEGT